MNAAGGGRARRSGFGPGTFGWLLAAGCLCAGFILLGNWQLRRLSWKLQLIHDVNTRVHAAPRPAPGPARWPQVRAGHLQYLHVRLEGRFLPAAPTLVHGTSADGYGYWVMAPFQTAAGFTVLVNRGYAPPGFGDAAGAARLAPPAGTATLTGLLRLSEPGGGFLRRNRPTAGQWYSRDVAAIGQARGLDAATLAPYFVDADAAPAAPGPWPAPGLTKLTFRNPHLGYALTWYGMAAAVAAGVGFAAYRARRIRRP
jgi:surfeit locus 1 family protein